MSKLRTRMEALLGETDSRDLEPASDYYKKLNIKDWVKGAESETAALNTKAVIAQLVLAMQAVGLDPADEEQLDQFMKLLKTLATNKAQMVKAAIKNWSGAKASRALRVAKKAI